MDMAEELKSAIAQGQAERVRAMIADGVDVNARIDATQLPITAAATSGDVQMVRTLLAAGADPNGEEGYRNETALNIAAREGRVEVARVLLAAGANREHRFQLPFTPLFQAVSGQTPGHLETVKTLIAAGADVNAEIPTRILTMAAWRGSPEIVQALLAAGAQVNLQDGMGTPLTRAVIENRPAIVEILLNAGADRTLPMPSDGSPKELAGLTALEIAKKKRLKKLVALLEAASAGRRPSAAAPEAPVGKEAIKPTWKRLEQVLKSGRKLQEFMLRKGTTAKALQELEKRHRGKLPEDFCAACRIHDGQEDAATAFIFLSGNESEGYRLLSLQGIENEWKPWKRLLDGGEFEGQPSHPDAGVRDDWWHPAWIPFAANGSGDSLCLDLAPAEGGRVGQVIAVRHDSPKRSLLANSFAEWLAGLAETLETQASPS